MIFYVKNPKDSACTQKRHPLEQINEFGKAAWYKTNTYQSAAFLYAKNEQSKKETKKTISFTLASKIVKYLLN